MKAGHSMINNLMQIAGFVMNKADAYRNYSDKCSYYVLDGGQFKMELIIALDQYTLWINDTEVTFRDKTVDPDSYHRFMEAYRGYIS